MNVSTTPSRMTALRRDGRRTSGFVERTLAALGEAIERDLIAEEWASRDGWLQRLDPRAKLVGVALAVISVGLARHLPVLGGLYLTILAIGLLAGLPAALLVRRVWVALPFFTAVIALPAVFGIVTPGPALVRLGQIGGVDLTITEPGLRTALTLLCRVAASVSAVLLLVLTTRWPVLLKALRVLKVPQVFTLMLAMTYRYVFLLAHVANSMFLARKSRTVGPVTAGMGRRWLGATMVSLLGKSYHLSNEVYLAMLARGFRGEPAMLDTFRMRPADWAALLVAGVLGATFILADSLYRGPW